MNTVVCLSVGNTFKPQYVSRLYDGLKRNSKSYFDFVCICDAKNASRIREAMPYGTIKLHIISEIEYPKWWGKMILFQPEFQEYLNTDILYFDLDSIITGPVDSLIKMKCPTKLSILRNFLQPPVRNPCVTPCAYGSAVMIIKRGCNDVYLSYKSKNYNVQEMYDNNGGDQKFIEDSEAPRHVTLLQDMFPDNQNYFRSVKYPTSLQEVPIGCSVLCYHGRPRPHEDQNNPIVVNHWI